MVRLYQGPPSPQEINESQGTNILICCAILISIPTLAVILRFWARFVKAEVKLWWDDWFLLFTLILSNALLATYIAQEHFGAGRHIEVIPPENIVKILSIIYAGAILYIPMQASYKITALFLYLRIFGANKRFRWFCWLLQGIIFLVSIITLFIYAVWQCNPPRKAFTPQVPGKCHNTVPYYLVTQSVNAALDISVLLTPLPMIWRLKLRASQKWWLLLIFSFGYCVAIVPLVRTGLIAAYAWVFNPEKDLDITWNQIFLDYAIVVEGPIAIVGLSCPPIFQLINRARQHGSKALFRSSTYPSQTTTLATQQSEREKSIKPQTSTAEMNSRLIQRMSQQQVNQHGSRIDPLDEIALNNILLRKDLSVMEGERHPSDDENVAEVMTPKKTFLHISDMA